MFGDPEANARYNHRQRLENMYEEYAPEGMSA